MITLAGVCPLTGLVRKVQYDFMIFRKAKQIIIDCEVCYMNSTNEIIYQDRIKPYMRRLMATDSLVDAKTGVLVELPYPNPTMTEFEFYDQLGHFPVALYDKIEHLIHLRHSEGKFDI